MAKRVVVGVTKSTIEGTLMRLQFTVDMEFVSQSLYDKAVSLGFDKEEWEKKNYPNKVLIGAEK